MAKSPPPEYGYTASIFSKANLELRVREAERDKIAVEGEIEVIDPATARVERIKANDPRFFSADGFKARRFLRGQESHYTYRLLYGGKCRSDKDARR